MTRSLFAVSFVLVVAAAALATNPLPDPLSYAKPTPDGRFVLVAFGDAAAEANLKDEAIKAKVEIVRARYAAPGLYPIDDPKRPVYLLEGYSPDDQVFLSADGTHVIRIEGEWWRTRAYPSGKRLDPAAEAKLLDAVAVRFFTRGVVTHEYPLRDLVSDPDKLPHSPDHILWPAGAVLNEKQNQFHLYTQDSNQITFDASTGEVVRRDKSGLGSPRASALIYTIIGLTAALAVGLGIWIWVRRKAGAYK